jgi:hypothetical protein
MLCFDLLTQGLHHELRLALSDHTKKLLWHTSEDPSFSLPEWQWSGYQISYGLKKEVKRYFISNKWHPYRSLQVRYTKRNWVPQSTDIYVKNEDKTIHENVPAQSHVFDVCAVFGRQWRKGAWFFDGYYGAGLGYKTLYTGWDKDKYDLLDTRFQDKRWNRVYVPVRLGFRVGVVL